MQFINNYFDTISKEFTMKLFVDELTKQLNKVMQSRHVVEAMESNRRVKEIVERRKNTEKFRQVILQNTYFKRRSGWWDNRVWPSPRILWFGLACVFQVHKVLYNNDFFFKLFLGIFFFWFTSHLNINVLFNFSNFSSSSFLANIYTKI